MDKLRETYTKINEILGDNTEPLESVELVEAYAGLVLASNRQEALSSFCEIPELGRRDYGSYFTFIICESRMAPLTATNQLTSANPYPNQSMALRAELTTRSAL